MKLSQQVSETTIGKDEAGLFLFHDTGISIEAGDKAFVLKIEDVFSGTIDNIYFKNKENAEKHN